jgi:hypothetical protein
MTFPRLNTRPFYGIAWPKAVIPISDIRMSIYQSPASVVSEIRHPLYIKDEENWAKWQMVYDAGDEFIEEYVVKFSRREGARDFARRKKVTPVAAFATSSVNEIKNSIFQRMYDVKRVGGPKSYAESCEGRLGGVDRKGANMTWFIGTQILPELLTKKKVGVYIDNAQVGLTLADRSKAHPYLYTYKAQDIRSWQETTIGSETVHQEVLLREYRYTKYDGFNLPAGVEEIFRHIYIGPDGRVHVQFYDSNNDKIGPVQVLNIRKIPFVVFEISDSLLKYVANHQIALTNLESSDISYALLANFPLYTEQFDSSAENDYIRKAQAAYRTQQFYQESPEAGPDSAQGLTPCPADVTGPNELEVGASQGRRYSAGLERPGFIAPPADPMRVSMEKQKELKDDVRKLVHLALSSIQSKMASAESKKVDQSGLESGLSYIGLELEHGERKIANAWATYENSTDEVQIEYPKLWSLETQEERDEKVERIKKVRDSIPSRTFQKEMSKRIARTQLEGTVPEATLQAILKEIEDSEFVTSDPDIVIGDFKSGLIPGELATVARGYPKEVYQKAEADRIKRAAEIIAAQQKKDGAAGGVPELTRNPNAGKDEKIDKPVRGEGK